MKIPKIKSATKLALFSTALLTLVMVVFYLFLLATINNPQISNSSQLLSAAVIILLPAAIVSYTISALIVDRVLNPVRVMIEKVKSMGEKNFNSKIFLDTSEEELVEYALEFNKMTSKVNGYIEKQKRFISDASHELATPITVIAGHADMLLRWGKEDTELLTSGLATIKQEAHAMNELVENLLFFTRSDDERIQYAMEQIDLPPLLEECVREHRLIHPEFTIDLICDFPARVLGDRDAIKRILRVLLTNSVKYSKERREIQVLLKTDMEFANIFVSDKGIGIPAEHLPHIFDRFYRVDDSRTKETGGTGLGLSIAKEIITAHQGVISAESEIDEGATITVRLPLLQFFI